MDIIKSILFPGPYDYDLRPMILVIIVMASSITYVIKRDWQDIQDDYNDDWELK